MFFISWDLLQSNGPVGILDCETREGNNSTTGRATASHHSISLVFWNGFCWDAWGCCLHVVVFYVLDGHERVFR